MFKEKCAHVNTKDVYEDGGEEGRKYSHTYCKDCTKVLRTADNG